MSYGRINNLPVNGWGDGGNWGYSMMGSTCYGNSSLWSWLFYAYHIVIAVLFLLILILIAVYLRKKIQLLDEATTEKEIVRRKTK